MGYLKFIGFAALLTVLNIILSTLFDWPTGIVYIPMKLIFLIEGAVGFWYVQELLKNWGTTTDEDQKSEELVVRVVWSRPGRSKILAEFTGEQAYYWDNNPKPLEVRVIDDKKYFVTHTYISGCKGTSGKTKLKIIAVQPYEE